MTGRVVDRHGHRPGMPGDGAARAGRAGDAGLALADHGRPPGLGDRIELDRPVPVRRLLRGPAGRRRPRARRDRLARGGRRPARTTSASSSWGAPAGPSSAGGCPGWSWAVLDDRERYRMLKYVVVSTAAFLPFLVGRAARRSSSRPWPGSWSPWSSASSSSGVQIDVGAIDWRLFVPSMAVGLVAIVALGLAVAGLCLTIRRESWSYPEAIAGASTCSPGPSSRRTCCPPFSSPLPSRCRPRGGWRASGAPSWAPRPRACWPVSTTRWS